MAGPAAAVQHFLLCLGIAYLSTLSIPRYFRPVEAVQVGTTPVTTVWVTNASDARLSTESVANCAQQLAADDVPDDSSLPACHLRAAVALCEQTLLQELAADSGSGSDDGSRNGSVCMVMLSEATHLVQYGEMFVNASSPGAEAVSTVSGISKYELWIRGAGSMESTVVSAWHGNAAERWLNVEGPDLRVRMAQLTVQRFNATRYEQMQVEGGGGAIRLNNTRGFSAENVTMRRCSVTALLGGAMLLHRRNHDVSLTHMRFESNSAHSRRAIGGALALANGNLRMSVRGLVATGNRATYQGGTIAVMENNDGFSCVDSSIRDSAVTDTGGAVLLMWHNHDALFQNLSVFNTSAGNNAGAIYVHANSHRLMILSSNFSHCEAGDVGGCLYIHWKNHYTRLEDLVFDNCRAAYQGGCIYIDQHNHGLTLQRSSFHNGNAGFGGILFINMNNNNMSVIDTEFADGVAWEGGAGAVGAYSANDDLLILRCVFRNSTAIYGGALMIEYTTNNATVLNSDFIGNTALNQGGGVFVNEDVNDLVVFDCRFQNNTAFAGGGAFLFNRNLRFRSLHNVFDSNKAQESGGGIYFDTYNLHAVLHDTRFLSNEAVFDGGGIYSSNPNDYFTLQESYFSGNLANRGGSYFSMSSRWIDVSSCSFLNGTAATGAGLVLYANHQTVSIRDSTFTKNGATNGGGIASAINNADMVIQNCSFAANVATTSGGAVFMYAGQLDTSIENCSFVNNSAYQGGAVMIEDTNKDIAFVANRMQGNVAFSGGAVYLDEGNSDVSFSDSTFVSNHAAESGGGVYFRSDQQSCLFERCLFLGCTAGNSGGALVSVLSTTGSAMIDTVVSGASSAAGWGGGLSFGIADEWILTNCTIEDSSAASGGGFAAVQATLVLLVNSVVAGNRATQISAGGIYASGSAQMLILLGSRVNNNTAPDAGGLSVSSTNLFISANSEIRGNRASQDGGGISASTNAAVYLAGRLTDVLTSSDIAALVAATSYNLSVLERLIGHSNGTLEGDPSGGLGRVRVCGNRAETGNGGGLFVAADSALTVVGADIDRNVARLQGGGLWVEDGSAQLCNASLTSNTVVDSDIQTTSAAIASTSTAVGGAIYAGTNAVLQVQDTLLDNNSATSNAGALMAASGAFVSLGENVSLVHNEARLGNAGAIYCDTRTCNFTDASRTLQLQSNRALHAGGGAVFWDWTIIGAAEPPGLRAVLESSTAEDANAASYGNDAATPLFRIRTQPRDHVIGVSGEALPPVRVHATDFYNNTVTSLSDNNFVTATATGNADPNCTSPQLSGSTVADFTDGVATFSDLHIACTPGSTARATFATTDAETGLTFRSHLNVTLEPCTEGQVVQQQVCVTCEAGKYSWSTTGDDCHDCLHHANCPGGAAVDVNSGYWRQGAYSTKVRWCPSNSACNGGTDPSDQCATGSKGPLCSVCEPGYYQPSAQAQCADCKSVERWAPLVILLVVLLCLSLFALWVYNSRPAWVEYGRLIVQRSSFRVHWKIIVSYLQITSMFESIFAVEYPPAYISTTSALGVSNLQFSSIFTPHCWDSSYDFYDTLLLQTLGVLLLAALMAVIFFVRICRAPPGSSKRKKLRALFFEYFLLWTYLVLPGTSTTIFQAFPCDNNFDDGKSYLKADYSISCNSAAYTRYTAYAGIMIVVIPVGILTLYTVTLWRHRQSICPEISDADRYQMLSSPFLAEADTARGDDSTPVPEPSGGQGCSNNSVEGRAPGLHLSPMDNGTESTRGDASGLNRHIEAAVRLSMRQDTLTTRTLASDVNACLECASSVQRPRMVDDATELVSQAYRELQFFLNQKSKELEPLLFLCEAYKTDMWWMEVLDTVRRLLMSSVIVFAWPGKSLQIVAAIAVCTAFLALYSAIQPFFLRSSNRIIVGALWLTNIQLFVTLLISENTINPSSTSTGAFMLFVLLVGPLLPLLDSAVSAVYHALRDHSANQVDEDGDPVDGWLFRLLRMAVGIRDSVMFSSSHSASHKPFGETSSTCSTTRPQFGPQSSFHAGATGPPTAVSNDAAQYSPLRDDEGSTHSNADV